MSVDSVANLLWLTVSIDRHFFGYVVAAMLYLLNYCLGWKTFHTSSIPWLYPSVAQKI